MKKHEVQEKPEPSGRESVERTRERAVFTPRCDIYETEKSVELVADMPGVDETSIDITLDDDVLTITGRMRDTTPLEGYRLIYAEFQPGDFQRSFALSNRADASGIKASVKHGVLRVSVPKAKPAQKKIPVMAE